jgi:hypothetical protein
MPSVSSTAMESGGGGSRRLLSQTIPLIRNERILLRKMETKIFILYAKQKCHANKRVISTFCHNRSLCKPVPDRQQHGTDNAGDKNGTIPGISIKDIPGCDPCYTEDFRSRRSSKPGSPSCVATVRNIPFVSTSVEKK